MKADRKWIYVTAGILVFPGFFAAVFTFAQVPDKAQILQEFRNRLSESDGICVHVNVITKEKSDEESMTEELKEDVEQLLDDAEIKIIEEEDLEYTSGRPRLGVFLVMYREPGINDMFLYSFQVVHFEDAALTRNYKFAEGICWNSGLYVGRERASVMKGVVKTHVQRYINDYLAANPKPPKRQTIRR